VGEYNVIRLPILKTLMNQRGIVSPKNLIYKEGIHGTTRH
jgi:hypothetical protein